MSDSVVLKKRAQYMSQLRPKARGDVGHLMNEPLPYYKSLKITKRKNRGARAHAIRIDESHKTRPNYPAAARPPPPIAMGVGIPPGGMQLGGNIAQGVPIAHGAHAVGRAVHGRRLGGGGY